MCLGHSAQAEAPASGISLATYEAQQLALNEQLAGLKRTISAPTQSSTQQARPSGKEIVEEKIRSLPASMQSLSPEDQKELSVLLGKIGEKYGAPIQKSAVQSILRDPETLRATIALVKVQHKNLDELVENVDALKQLLSNPKALLVKYKQSTSQPILPKMLAAMKTLKTRMSPSEWWSTMTEFVGRFFIKFWHNVWQMVSTALISVIGEEKIYELNRDGTVKTDAQGNKLPKLIPQYRVNENGEAVKEMVPTKWFTALADEESLLGQLVQSGIDKSIISTFKSLDRLFYRPIVSDFLTIPLWKLSHVHYQLAMTQRRTPDQALITPKILSDYILKEKDPGKLLTAGLPFSLRSIMANKDAAEKNKVLQVAVTKHLWQIYQPIWKDIQAEVKVGISATGEEQYALRDEDYYLRGAGEQLPARAPTLRSKTIDKAKEFSEKVQDEVSGIIKDSLTAKIQEGPLTPYLMYANLALNIPQAMFGMQFTSKPTTALTDDEGTEISPELTAAIMKAIDICDAIARKARENNQEQLSDNDTVNLEFKLALSHSAIGKPTEYKISIAPTTLKKLMERQESGLKRYLPFMEDHLAGESYENYFSKLIIPRLVFKLFPQPVRKKLGIHTIADTSDSIEIIKKYYAITYNTIESISKLMSTIKQFEEMTNFAGHYVFVTDKVYDLMLSVNRLVATLHPAPKDPWEKRIAAFTRYVKEKTVGPSLKDSGHTSWYQIKNQEAFTVTQLQKIAYAQGKSGYATQNPVLFLSKKDIFTYLNAKTAEELNAFKTAHFTGNNEQIQETVRLQSSNIHLTPAPKNLNPITYLDLKRTIQRAYKNIKANKVETPSNDNDTVLKDASLINMPSSGQSADSRIKEITNRATDVILQTFGLLSMHKTATHDEFFTGTEAQRKQKKEEIVAKEFASFTGNINSATFMLVSQVKEIFHVLSRLYAEWGLREIAAAFDAHYLATGEAIKDLPLKTFAKIARNEWGAHLVGYGADELLKKALKPLMNQLAKMQENNMFGGQVLNQMANKHIGMIFGNTHGRTNAYTAARTLMHNIFDYGVSTALKPSNLMATVASNFIPGMNSDKGIKEAQDLMLHAKMAAESGRAPNPVIAHRLKKAGFDPAMMMAQQRGPNFMMEEPTEGETDPGDDAEAAQQLSPALLKLLEEAEEVHRTQGPDAAKKFIQEKMDTLTPEEREELAQFGF
ncbi:MAG: hypothetical protein QG632_517 [Candidatus Dependentiae bacterium]|nr:hypothetical protein [Candidatus Dependentiae bacterium]